MVGREQEIKDLNRLYDRNKAELVAIYGRWNVAESPLRSEIPSNDTLVQLECQWMRKI